MPNESIFDEVKDTKSRVQKQTFMFDYAETEYLRRSQRQAIYSDFDRTSRTTPADKSIGRNGNGDTGLHDSEYFTTFVFR
ncbi:MAG TPA: hypothetical protein DEW31_07575 [Alistipes obesi]|nr:hypothetical protein [Alistipes communis]